MSAPKNRKDSLTAQRVEVGLVFQQMLGTDEAAEYMRTNHIPGDVIKRVLDTPADRRQADYKEVGQLDAITTSHSSKRAREIA